MLLGCHLNYLYALLSGCKKKKKKIFFFFWIKVNHGEINTVKPSRAASNKAVSTIYQFTVFRSVLIIVYTVKIFWSAVFSESITYLSSPLYFCAFGVGKCCFSPAFLCYFLSRHPHGFRFLHQAQSAVLCHSDMAGNVLALSHSVWHTQSVLQIFSHLLQSGPFLPLGYI